MTSAKTIKLLTGNTDVNLGFSNGCLDVTPNYKPQKKKQIWASSKLQTLTGLYQNLKLL